MTSITEEILPDFFKDVTRKNALYAPLRSKMVNPIDWNFKITSWKKLINLYCSSNKVFCFSLESLKVAFQDNGRTPSCLDEVLKDMLQNNEIEPLVIFMEKRPKTWIEWAKKSLISLPLAWSLKMKNFINSPDLNKVEYVHINVIYHETELLFKELSVIHKNEVISLAELLEERNIDVNKQKYFKILLVSLYNQYKVDLLEIEQSSIKSENSLVKICDPLHYEPISEVDLGIQSLKTNEKALEQNIAILTENAKRCRDEAKCFIANGQKELAKISLKKKHEIEYRIKKKAETLCNLHILWNKLQDMTLNEEVWSAYKKALGAFERNLSKGVDTDAVDDIMMKVTEMLEIQSDMESALGRSVLENRDEDLEKELEDLLENNDNEGIPRADSEESLTKAMKIIELNLPSVQSSPVTINCSDHHMSKEVD